MINKLVQTKIKDAYTFLGHTVQELETFLNCVTLESLLAEKNGDIEYYKGVMSGLRRLLVYCEEGYDATSIIMRSSPFSPSSAEHTLYGVYHKCIQEFYAPHNDLWYEDSRSAFTGKQAIHFRQALPESIERLLLRLETPFQTLREELEYYDTEFRTKMMQTNR
ncbi:DUF3907 family protein [Jeotgalibacillus soli]|uniref:DUF3907 domain-containing protein n=1 Tax=Jeotgalibacillus soli TaxID=889306 RepID=A0A0C2RR61_9BACL|nr:DUF3907 family protein [Jeotgalibacillus soli]KIL44244.1 hypothetical protein KP78_32080 [Jeotgalibacillus soli]